ncbi:hypothetical protein LSAT2_016124 [Lamellibrachia satsuma]|nr:hypothetical protein LSAT2_016124 [Lamellibrachia satsuma]
MTYAGARGPTANEMCLVLGFCPLSFTVHASFRATLGSLGSLGSLGPRPLYPCSSCPLGRVEAVSATGRNRSSDVGSVTQYSQGNTHGG